MGKGRSKEVTDMELIEAGREVSGPAFTSREVADAVGLERDTVRVRLNNLATDGVIHKKSPSSLNIYWVESASTTPTGIDLGEA